MSASEDRPPLFYNGPDPITLNSMRLLVEKLHTMQRSSAEGQAALRRKGETPKTPSMSGDCPPPWGMGNNPEVLKGVITNSSGSGNLPPPWNRSLERQVWWAQDDLDPRRSVDQECGYPAYVAPEGFKALIDREPIAGVCNDLYPEESWVGWPTVYDTNREVITSPFEKAWAALPENMTIGPNYHGDSRGNAIFDKLLLADKLCGIGRYGAVLLEYDDDPDDLSIPILPRPYEKNGRKLVNIRPFPEHLCRIIQFDQDRRTKDGRKNRRYGFPSMYMCYFSDPQDMSRTGINGNFTATMVHWSRILPITDMWHHPSSSEVFAIERLRPLLNPIMDVRKVRAASAEMYWKGAFGGHHFGTHPSLGPDVDVDRESIIDMYQDYTNTMQRLIISSGMTIDDLAPQVVDPTTQLLVQYSAIAMKMRAPIGLLMGTEKGEPATGEGRMRWNKRLYARQHEFNTPGIVAPFTNRLISMGCLPEPAKGDNDRPNFNVYWPDPSTVSPMEKADVFLKRMQAWGFYVSQGVGMVFSPLEVATRFDGMDREDAITALDDTNDTFDPMAMILKTGGGTGAEGGREGAKKKGVSSTPQGRDLVPKADKSDTVAPKSTGTPVKPKE